MTTVRLDEAHGLPEEDPQRMSVIDVMAAIICPPVPESSIPEASA